MNNLFRLLRLLLTLIVVPASAMATDRYVDNTTTGCSTPSDNDYDPNTETCGSGSALVYSSISAARTAMVGGDTMTIMAGTYTGTANQLNSIPSGTASARTIIQGDPSSSATCAMTSTCLTIINNNGTRGIYYFTASYATVRNLKVLGTSNSQYPVLMGVFDNTTPVTGNILSNVEVAGPTTLGGTGISMTATASFSIVEYCNIHDNGQPGGALGIYQQGDDGIIRYNWIHHNGYYGIQTYNSGTASDGRADRNQIIGNLVEDNDDGAIAIGGQDQYVAENIFKGAVGTGFDGGTPNLIFVNNVMPSNGVNVGGGANQLFRNNVLWGNLSGGATNTHNACRAGDSCGSSKLTYAALTDLFTSTTTYTLKAGSTAINAGTTVSGRNCNGTCDIGAHETFGFASGTISGSTAEIVLGMGLHVPVQPTVAGWALTCTPNPTACFTATITGVTLKSGSSSTILLTFTGGNPASGQDWTVTYNPATGNTTNSANIGGTPNQELSAITAQAITNNGTGGGGPSPPGGLHLHYLLDEGAGTNANDQTANNLDGTLTNGAAWGEAFTNSGLVLTQGSTQHLAIPYGSGVNPSSQSLTIATWVKLSSEGIVMGTPVGSSQRLYVAATNGTWRLAIQGTSGGTVTEFPVQLNEWTHVCVTMNSATDTATLHIDGVAGTSAGAVKSYTSYALAGNFRLGYVDNNLSPGAVYDHVKIWTSVESCAAEFAANTPPQEIEGQLSQTAHRFQRVYLKNGSVVNLGSVSGTREVVDGGSIALMVQINCDNVADCDQTSFVLRYSTDGTNFNLAVPDNPTSDGVYFWGDTVPRLNNGAADGPITGSLTHTDGPTQLRAAAVPSVDLAQNTSLTLRWILRFAPGHANQSRYFKVYEQSGVALTGGYTPSSGARVDIVPTRASAGP